jgi:hypothetical protein
MMRISRHAASILAVTVLQFGLLVLPGGASETAHPLATAPGPASAVYVLEQPYLPNASYEGSPVPGGIATFDPNHLAQGPTRSSPLPLPDSILSGAVAGSDVFAIDGPPYGTIGERTGPLWEFNRWTGQTTQLGAVGSWVAASPDGTKVYVDGPSGLVVVNAFTGQSTATIPLAKAGPVSVDPESGRIWVATDSGLEVVDPLTGNVQQAVTTSPFDSVAFTPGTAWAATADGSGQLDEIATTTLQVLRTIQTIPAQPVNLYVGTAQVVAAPGNPDVFSVVWVTPREGEGGDYLVEVDRATGVATTVSEIFDVGTGRSSSDSLAISPDGGTLYLAQSYGHSGYFDGSTLYSYNARTDAQLAEWDYPGAKPWLAGVVVAPPYPPLTQGYWQASADGGVFAFGTAPYLGSMAGHPLAAPVVGIAPTPGGRGYWLAGGDGGVFTFGDATFWGSMGGQPLNAPIVGLAPTPSGKGYWEVAADGGVFSFGNAPYLGSMGGRALNAPIVGLAPTPSGKGYWEVAADGGVFSFGDARFLGSMGGRTLNAPAVSLIPSPDGQGYWEVGADGGVFCFGDAPYLGSAVGQGLSGPVTGAAAVPGGTGLWFTSATGETDGVGSAENAGSAAGASLSPVEGMAAQP